MCLRNSFKNFRRDRSSNDVAKHGFTFPQEDSSPKRQKMYDPYIVDISEDEYEVIIEQLKEEHKKKKKYQNHDAILQLMERSLSRRRKWIVENKPLVIEILNKFPLLDTSEVVSLYH